MSGVYIKGMEMPKDGEHPYWVVIHSDGTVEYNENKGQGWQTSEAVPVPDHGRLIDGDAIRQTMFIGEQCLYSWDEIEDAIDYAKTVIPADKET